MTTATLLDTPTDIAEAAAEGGAEVRYYRLDAKYVVDVAVLDPFGFGTLFATGEQESFNHILVSRIDTDEVSSTLVLAADDDGNPLSFAPVVGSQSAYARTVDEAVAILTGREADTDVTDYSPGVDA